MPNYPRELVLGDLCLSPLLVAVILALLAAGITAGILNRLRLSRFFVYPQLTFFAFVVLYALLIDGLWIRF